MLVSKSICSFQNPATKAFEEKDERTSYRSSNVAEEELIIEPGLVVLRNFVSDLDCRKLAEEALEMGEEGEAGFYTKTNETEEKTLNTGENRGRIYDKAVRFPSTATSICDEAVSRARSLDEEGMPTMTCTHILLNLYTTAEGLRWHRDIYENDGKSDHPVVNLCVGAACKFGVKHDDSDKERVILLRSGDVLVFGGPCRFIQHAVLEVILDDCPNWMAKSPFRLSFTFRDSPEVIGREEEFKYFRIKDDLVGQGKFECPALATDKRVEDLRSSVDVTVSAATKTK